MRIGRVKIAIFLVAAILVMYNVTPAAALTKSFSSSGTTLQGTVSFDGSVSYTKGYDANGWATYRIDGVTLNHVYGMIILGMEAALIVDVWVWIDDAMIWWWNEGPPDMPWASFCIPWTPFNPYIPSGPIYDTNIVINQGGTTGERTGYKLHVRVRAQVTGWTNLVGINPFLPCVPFPIVPIICSWDWYIGSYPSGGGGGHTPD